MKIDAAKNVAFHAGQAELILEHAINVIKEEFDENCEEDRVCLESLATACANAHCVKVLLNNIYGIGKEND